MLRSTIVKQLLDHEASSCDSKTSTQANMGPKDLTAGRVTMQKEQPRKCFDICSTTAKIWPHSDDRRKVRVHHVLRPAICRIQIVKIGAPHRARIASVFLLRHPQTRRPGGASNDCLQPRSPPARQKPLPPGRQPYRGSMLGCQQ